MSTQDRKIQNKLEGFPGDNLGATIGIESKKAGNSGVGLWEVRTEERPYAFLRDVEAKECNSYGQKIDLLDLTDHQLPEGRSMYINENPAVGENPNRNKQHGFFFTADNCIGCHACEAACSEKNENPAHLAFRSVGYVEGGSYPDYKRMNISMACNHCDDPVCLKGCPTRAYTKHVEYGAVLQDPETCFGCGYCTWVCPYNAPQLDPIKGQVSKCNMCVDRLEEGLKPACVSACVGNALDFGVIEDVPEHREQAKCSIPGFPDPEITHPNIRFQQTRSMPEEMKRTDSMPVKYHRNEDGQYKPVVDQKKGKSKHWNFARLSSRENPLVLFTLSAQTAVGAFALAFLGAELGIDSLILFQSSVIYVPLMMLCFGLVGFGLFMSTMHLGKPHRFYRGFNNLRHSPVCREGLSIAVFMATLGLHILLSLPANPLVQELLLTTIGSGLGTFESVAALFGYLAIPAGLAGLYYMNRCYRIKARPFWNHWQVASSFFGNMLSLGGFIAAVLIVATLALSGSEYLSVIQIAGSLMVLGMMAEATGLVFHNRDMNRGNHEGSASHYIQCTTFGKTYLLRNGLLALNLMAALTLTVTSFAISIPVELLLTGWTIIGLIQLFTSTIGRALFYVLVIPTTMPGAFFWKNKGFEEHARDIGLADMPQVGVVPHLH
ncbi:DmsC/YnfH family molybdoenzyme membrane anchor subunit [Amphritea sp. HPY]|uniref:DmsC/YnfH family molybdoenzyme membrane anchor subunit n=1 Tax=Amphritea sp. HPY TaxID=3421652 RepID=UPI003D7CD606